VIFTSHVAVSNTERLKNLHSWNLIPFTDTSTMIQIFNIFKQFYSLLSVSIQF
jgi:hypothetical protein